MSSNCVYLAKHYGLVDILEDEIKCFDENNPLALHTRGGRTLEADVILLCVGFDTDESVLEHHVVNDSWFVDGVSNITHNLRGDRVNGQNLIGPRVRCRNFLISYYEDAQVSQVVCRSGTHIQFCEQHVLDWHCHCCTHASPATPRRLFGLSAPLFVCLFLLLGFAVTLAPQQ